MKTKNSKKPNLLLVMALILFLPIWEGCEKTKLANEEGKMSLNDTPEDTEQHVLNVNKLHVLNKITIFDYV